MNKQDFLAQLEVGLVGLPQEDIKERLNFYSEMIDDQIEEGSSEEAAISQIGAVDKIISEIIADVPLAKIIKEKITPKKKLKAWEIVLLVLGSPVWLSLGVAVFSVVFSICISLWAVIISLWAVFVSLIGCAFGSIIAVIGSTCNGNVLNGVAMIAAGLVCTGLSIFLFYGCKTVTKVILQLTKKIALGIKSRLAKKEEIK